MNRSPGQVGDGDPTGIVQLFPGDPGYPTPEQFAQLKGTPVGLDVTKLLPEEVAALTQAGLILTDSSELKPVVDREKLGQQPVVGAATDSQVTELLGRNRLVSELLIAGLEVALPLRDRGIDLIAYADMERGVDDFFACPIQMKAARGAIISLDKKYQKIHNLIIAYIWYVEDPSKAVTYAMTYAEARDVFEVMGWSNSPTWKAKGQYAQTRAGTNQKLLNLLDPYKMSTERWRKRIVGDREV